MKNEISKEVRNLKMIMSSKDRKILKLEKEIELLKISKAVLTDRLNRIEN